MKPARAVLAVCALAALGCSVGSGEGWVSGLMFLKACGYAGGADPAVEGSPFVLSVRYLFGDVAGDRLDIRLQDSGAFISRSDGLTISLRNRHDIVAAIRTGGPVSVPVYGEPPPLPVTGPDIVAQASLYFNRSCPDSYVDFSEFVSGTIEFTSMYARTDDGDYADIDRIHGSFTGLAFQDPRPEVADENGVAPWVTINGEFDFDYTRGRPAQPFP
jgi:hypothetical protein